MGKLDRIVADQASAGPEHEAWFGAQVEAARDSTQPDVPHEDMMDEIRTIIDARRAAQNRLGG